KRMRTAAKARCCGEYSAIVGSAVVAVVIHELLVLLEIKTLSSGRCVARCEIVPLSFGKTSYYRIFF
ncbi:hypothetical protein, partial [Igneacidithiobacillus copahuensis]|uniref:hypothetical protein n=1 Tax=Igneacidithiobacillus copahuensis TaxID=2724909 RepID=UPI001C076C47